MRRVSVCHVAVIVVASAVAVVPVVARERIRLFHDSTLLSLGRGKSKPASNDLSKSCVKADQAELYAT